MLHFVGFLVVVILIFRINFFVVEVVGSSMEPTLKNGNYLLATRLFPRNLLRQQQIMVCKLSAMNDGKIDYIIKRIKACPQESINLAGYKIISDALISYTHEEILYLPDDMYILSGEGICAKMLWGPIHKDSITGIVLLRLY